MIAVASVLAIAAACSRQVPSESPLPPPEARPSIVASAVVPTPTAALATTFVPLPTSPKTLAEPGGELLIACDGPPFSASLLDRPADDELAAGIASVISLAALVAQSGLGDTMLTLLGRVGLPTFAVGWIVVGLQAIRLDRRVAVTGVV